MKTNTQAPSIYEADAVHLANAMQRGGGFLSSLATALIRADLENRRKILETWEYEITREWEAQYPEITQYGVYRGKV